MFIPHLRAWPRHAAALALCLAALPLHAAEAITVADVRFAPTQQLQGQQLQLNGAGLRRKAAFKVYAAGLYLEQHAGSAAQVLAQPGPKRLRVVMLRDVNAEELGRSFMRGMQDSLDRSTFSKLAPSLLRMGELFAQGKALKTGDGFTIDWLPGTGMVVTINDQILSEPFTEPGFFEAMLGIWLGQHPADEGLKQALLGGSS